MTWHSITRNSCKYHDHSTLVYTYHRRLEQHIRLEQRHAAHGNRDKHTARCAPKEERRNPPVLLACLDEKIYALEGVLGVADHVSFPISQMADTYIEPK